MELIQSLRFAEVYSMLGGMVDMEEDIRDRGRV